MANMNFDGINRKLLGLLQVEFPLIKGPYRELGLKLGIGRDEVINRIKRLKAEGVIHQISPVLDARRLGYQMTLVAMRVARTQLDRAEQLIAGHPGVSHGYERDHHFNVWFTLAIPPMSDIETELKQLASPIDVEAVLALPAVKLFKIGAYFDMDGNGQVTAGIPPRLDGVLPEKVELSQTDRLVINELQQDLPLVTMPFASMAERLGMDEQYFLTQCRSLLQRGIMRRFGAAINHNRAGFKANAMACWVVPAEKVEVAGQELASLREVSHCYERKTNILWPYNLFAMIHGQTREVCQNIVGNISRRMELKDFVLLFSTKEFKKTRTKYLV
jgi:siroheme decarboxylase